MSGWIKMGVGLRRHPKVVRIASALKADRLRVVGALHAVWCVFDEHSDCGELFGYSLSVMDEEIGWKGFSAAMKSVGWIEEGSDSISVPDYEEHNGPTAKRRAMETSRKGKARKTSAEDPQEDDEESGQVSASDADKVRNREEKRREEKKEIHPPPPGGGSETPASPSPSPTAPPAFDGRNAEVLNGKSVVPIASTWELPESWGIDAEALGWAPAEVLREAEKLRQWATVGKGKGTRRSVKGWRQTWSNWLEKAARDQR